MKAIGMDVQTYPIEPHSVIIGKIGSRSFKKDSFVYMLIMMYNLRVTLLSGEHRHLSQQL